MKMNKYECNCEDNNCRLESYKRPIFCPNYRNTSPDWRVIDEVHGLENIKDEITNSENADVEVANSRNEVVEVKERWKPKYDELYWYISQLDLIKSWYWMGEDIDHEFYEIGNVFQSYEQAKQALEKVKETLINFHKEIENE